MRSRDGESEDKRDENRIQVRGSQARCTRRTAKTRMESGLRTMMLGTMKNMILNNGVGHGWSNTAQERKVEERSIKHNTRQEDKDRRRGFRESEDS